MLYHSLAPLLVATGDKSAYQALCSRILEHFGGIHNPVGPEAQAEAAIQAGSWYVTPGANAPVADRMAKDCLILPASGVDMKVVVDLAESAVSEGANNRFLPYFHCTLGLARYRQGRFADALECLRKTLAESQHRSGYEWDDYLFVEAYATIAMANWRMDARDQASDALKKASECAETKLPRFESGNIGSTWRDWIVAHALLDEARALMGGAPDSTGGAKLVKSEGKE
jgi:hypothetical protein